MASSTEHNTLPVLPLPGDVLLPGMVVTISLESDEAKAAARAAEDSDGTLLLVPRIGSTYAKVGVVAKVESTGQLPGGTQALVVRGTGRAHVGQGVVGTGSGLWVNADPVTVIEITDEAKRLGTELRATLRALFEFLGRRQRREHPRVRRPERPRGAGRPGRLVAGAERRAQGRAARDRRRRSPRAPRPRVGPGGPGRARAGREDRRQRPRRPRGPAEGAPAPPPDGRHPQGAR